MKRTALVAPSSLGALEAYRLVITDISKVLGDPNIDVARLFFAVMIQSGLQRFSLPKQSSTDLVSSPLLADRLGEISYASVEHVLQDIREQITRSVKATTLVDSDRRVIHNLASFLQDLYLAAEFRRPVATVIDKPDSVRIHRLLREDAALVIDGLLASVTTVDVEAPVARYEMLERDLKSFRAVMSSDVFEPYVASQKMFEMVSQGTDGVAAAVRARARDVVQAFQALTDLKPTAVRTLEAIPAVVDATAGKVFGALSKPFITALSDALGRDQRLLVYSFYPTWQQIWGGKLDKVRVLLAAESTRSRY